jgi:hypothetical protein
VPEIIDLGDQRVPVEAQRFAGDDSRAAAQLARSKQGKTAAALATMELVASFAGNGSPTTQANAARVYQELAQEVDDVLEEPDYTPVATVAAPEPAAAAVVEEEIPTDYELPSAWADDLDDDEEPEQIIAEVEPYVEAAEDDEYTDPEVLKLRKQLAAEQQRSSHERKLRVQTAKKDWASEAKQVLRLGTVELVSDAELAGIDADSRRDFRRKAKDIADRNKEIALRFAPKTAAPAVESADVEEQIEARAREIEAERWGRPPATGPAANANSPVNERLRKAQRTGNLAEIFKARLYGDQ